MNKKSKLIICFFVFCIFVSNIFANNVSVNFPSPSGDVSKVKTSAQSFWANFEVVIQVLSVAAVVFAGVRYMFASVDERADIKNGLIFLVIGAILVFGAITVINLIKNAGNAVLVY